MSVVGGSKQAASPDALLALVEQERQMSGGDWHDRRREALTQDEQRQGKGTEVNVGSQVDGQEVSASWCWSSDPYGEIVETAPALCQARQS